MKNRVTVIGDTFQKSVFYILLRGRPAKDKAAPAPVNLSKVVASLIKQSGALLRRQARLPAPTADENTESKLLDFSEESGNFCHGLLVNFSIGCLIEMCLFIETHAHSRGNKKRQSKKQSEEAKQEEPAGNANADNQA